MSPLPIISVKNIGKKYKLGATLGGRNYKTLRDVLTKAAFSPFRKLSAVFRKEPFTGGSQSSPNNPITQSPNNQNALSSAPCSLPSAEASPREFWALKDISFDVQQGEVVGIIGRNGAGKSTLLKILCGITEPTEGEINIRGRIASLLEVGTGFHPELSGRENIFMNGAILGMTKSEIKAKFDEIVAFAEVEKFIDTPVKRYSSGMHVRLAFAVAAHLEPEILLVDEVLAVGDAAFQKKCLGKMGDVARGGRTILFVSHNMAAMQALCSRAFLLDSGNLVLMGTPHDVVSGYFDVGSKTLADRNLSQIRDRKGGGTYLRLMSFDVVGSDGKSLADIPCGSKVNFELNFQVFSDEINNLRVGIVIKDRTSGVVVTSLNSYYGSKEVLSCEKGDYKYVFTVNRLPLAPNQYSIGFIATSGLHVLDWLKDVCQLKVREGLFYESGQMPIDKNSQIFFTEYTCGLNKDNEINNS